jgi:hypothetical protein
MGNGLPLPLGRKLSTRACVVSQRGDLVAMKFTSPPGTIREAVGERVESRLATHQDGG